MMQDRGLVIALTAQAALQGAASSAALAEIAPRPVVAGVALASAMLAMGTAAYVAATKDPRQGTARRLDLGGPSGDDEGSGPPPTSRR